MNSKIMLNYNILSIDFGATYTKLAYRKGFTEGKILKFEERDSVSLSLEGVDLIPTLAIETQRKDLPWIFGRQAAELKPSKRMKIHRNWKSKLLTPNGKPPSKKSLKIARVFFEWLLNTITSEDSLPFKVNDAIVMLCIPAFKDNLKTLAQLDELMRQAGWSNKFILKTTEPKANIIGVSSEGRNVRTVYDTPNWGEMFSESHPFIQYTRNSNNHGHATLALLDIGSFTSDLSLVNWYPGQTEGYLNNGKQVSFNHGITEELDGKCLNSILDDACESIDTIDFFELENLKVILYSENEYELGGFTLGEENHKRLIQESITEFCEILWKKIHPIITDKPIQWYLITGGGANISRIKKILTKKFKQLNSNISPPQEINLTSVSRIDTAIGGTSIILLTDKPSSNAKTTSKSSFTYIRPSSNIKNCSCGGMNPNCFRCSGRGFIQL